MKNKRTSSQNERNRKEYFEQAQLDEIPFIKFETIENQKR